MALSTALLADVRAYESIATTERAQREQLTRAFLGINRALGSPTGGKFVGLHPGIHSATLIVASPALSRHASHVGQALRNE